MTAFCPLCGAGAMAIHQDRGRRFVHCPACDLVSVPRSCHLSAEEQRARYARHRNSIDNVGYVRMLNGPVELLRRYAGTARRVLDYGSGPAPVMVELLRRAGYEAIGYDPFFSADTDVSLPFDAVLCVETIEHFADPRGELEKIRRLLRPGGCLVVMTLLHNGPASIADWWYARDATHVAFYSAATLGWIAAALGFQLDYCDKQRLALLQRTAPPAAPGP
jgi:SAM-dependent methyltransferase